MKIKKTHYREVFKSDHLGVADLEEMIENDKSLIVTIKHVKKEVGVSVAGRKGNHNIAYFKEDIKPLVLNATNSKIIKSFTKSVWIDDWKDVIIELYIDSGVKMKGEIVGGVRIRQIQPQPKVKPNFTEVNFEAAKKANATIERIKQSYNITKDIETKYNDYVAKK